MKKRKRCIPLYRPHQWHWDNYNERDHVLTLRCGRCKRYKFLQNWKEHE